MAVKVKWTGNAANLPKERKNDTTPTVRYVGMGSGGNTYQPYAKTENNTARTVTVENTAPEAQSGGKGFFKRAGLTVSGGAKGSLAGNMDAMGVAYEAGQGGRTQRYTDELREAQWAVARAKHDYDADPGNQLGKNALDTAITKMKAFADTLGKGAYEQALTAAYDVAAKLDTGDLKALYNGLGVVTPEKGTGTQQKAASAARDLAYEVQKSASEDLQRAKEGASKFGKMLVDAGASMTQMGLDTAANALMGTQGTMIPFATRAFGGSTMDARQDGADLKGQALYGGAQAAKEVFTEKMFNIALPFAKAYGKGGLDQVVENGIHMAAEKLGKSDIGRAALEKVLKFGASAVSEGLEEFVGDFMEWQMPRIYGGDTDSLAETFSNALYDFAVGTISGAAGGAVGNVMDSYNESVQARETEKAYAGREQELLDESKELNPGNDLAKKYQERLDNGKKITGRQLMRLIEQNETDAVAGDKAKIQSAAEGRLTQLGETGDAAQIAQAITKQVAGEKLSTAEQSLIDESRYGRRVANEIDPENVKAVVTKDGITPRDTFASEWTGKLDTKRIYPEVFNRLMPQPQKTKEVTARQKGEVTGAKYNAETGRLDAIVTNEAGEVKTVPAAEAEMTPMQEELFDWADELKLKAAGPLMVRAYQPEQNMELYTRSFKLAYEYGKAGMPMDYVEKSEGVNYLHPTQIKLAYEEGQAATQRKVQAREEKIRSGGTMDSTTKKKGSVSLRGAKVGSKTYAPVNRKTVDSRQWASVKAMRAFSRAVGVDVVFYQSQANERGVYEGANGFYKGGKLYLDINAGRDTVGMTETAILKTAAHELTHFIQDNSAQYEVLKSFVVNKLTHEEGVSFEDLVADKQRREPGLEYDEAVDEVVADACEVMLGDSTVVEQLAKENRSLAEKIRDWLREWVENLKIALEGLQADRTESRAMMQYARELQEIWDNALMDAAQNNRGTMEAESRQQASPRKKYWRPDLAENEWRLLERRISEEIGSRENFLDEATKWVYANEKGVQVFALYGIGDGTDATPLYAVGGEKAAAAAADMQNFVNGGYHYDKGTGTALSRIRGFLRTQGDGGGDIRETSRGGSAGTDDALYGGERKGNAGGAAERGSEDQRGVKEKFSMREPAEETRDLLALHNMTLDNLRGALKLGGLPMPSIAIVKAKSGHDQYGPISLVFRKDTIDPQLFRSNKVYGYDAWTPTAPRIEYEVNEKAADKLRELYYRMQREKGRDFAAPLYSVANTLEDELNNKGGLDKVVDTMRDDTRIMQIYLEDTGAGSVANVMRKNVTRMSEGEIEMAQALTEKLGEKTIQSISAQTGESPFSARRRWFAKYGEAVNDALTAYYEQEGIPHEEALRAVEAETTANKIKSVLLARKYLNGNAEVITEEVDREATDKAIREKVNQNSYDQWLEGLFSGVVKNSGIYNGKDYYTASGNRRSFSATHYEVNLENTVRAMKQGDQTGVGTFFGGQAIWGVTAKDYRSIEEIKEDSGRLQKLSEEEYSQIRQQFTERLANITSEIMDKNNGNEFTASDDAASAIVETLRTKHTVKAIDKELRTYPTLRIQPDTAQKVFDLCRDISNMPTGYFEAKPQRAVGFDEAAAVVVPDNLPADLRKGLEQIGATVREYKAGDEQSRLEAVNADERVLFQQREPRLSDRDVLRMAADMAQRDRSQRWSVEDLNRFDLLQRKLQQLDEANAELEALKEERKVLLAGRKVKELTRDEQFDLAQNRNRTETQKSKIQRLEEETYKIESVPQVKALLKKSRSIVERAADSKARAEFREAREKQEVLDVTRRKVERNAKRLLEYMNTNTDKKHIPEALKKPIGELLESLDFYSNSARKGGNKTRADQRYCEAMQGLQSALAAQKLFDDTGEGTDLFKGYLDLPAGFESMLGVHVERVKTAMEKHPLKTDIVRKMDLDDLRDLDVILSVMSRSVTQMNEMFVNRRFAYVADAAEDSIESMDRLGQHQDKAKGAEQFALWDNTLPWYAFQRFGEGGKAVFEGLQDGWDKLAFNMKTVLDFRQELIKDTVARKWDTETHKVELTDPDGATVTATLTTAQLMSLYCLSKRKQALGHLLGGGIRPAAIELTDTLGDRVRKRSLTQDKQYKLTDESLGQLLKLLTPEQKKIADAMQKFMTEQGSAWGNAVTMARFGYRGFTEQNYFPIETDAQDRQAKTGDTKEGSLYRLQNISAVKPLVKNANNALILRGIFDVFANHTADMAKYNAMVLPIIDAQKWYNYKYASKNEAGQVSTRTVQRAMTRAYGGAANSFVIKYMQDLNGVKESGDRGDTLPKKMISNYKRAMVAANMRVALLQPTAYVRASAVLDYKYLVKAFADKTGTKQATKEMLENSGIALWKSLGFFDTDVGRSVRDQIKGKSGKLENLVDKTMIPAEKGDEITWARLWRACKLEVQDKQSLTGDELLKATAERFREVVYRTQVVDSTMTRSHMMRGSGTLSKMTTSFMSEPTVSYNMVMESTRQIAEDAKRLGMRVALRRNWKVAGRAYQAYIVSAVVTAIVESLYDALRDSDDDDYLDKVWKAFGGEKPETVKDGILNVIFGLNGNLAGDINPIGKVPYLRDVVSILGGYSNGRMDTEAVANLKKAVDIWDEVIRLQTGDLDKATKTTYYGNMTTYGMIYPTAKALSQLTGLPGSAAMREIVTVWNSTVGAAWPNLKRRTYENKQLREAWEKYGKASGVSYAVMYRATQDTKDFESDKDADGNTISGSLKAKYVEYIRSLGLPRAQEKAVWEAAKVSSWSDKGTPWG